MYTITINAAQLLILQQAMREFEKVDEEIAISYGARAASLLNQLGPNCVGPGVHNSYVGAIQLGLLPLAVDPAAYFATPRPFGLGACYDAQFAEYLLDDAEKLVRAKTVRDL